MWRKGPHCNPARVSRKKIFMSLPMILDILWFFYYIDTWRRNFVFLFSFFPSFCVSSYSTIHNHLHRNTYKQGGIKKFQTYSQLCIRIEIAIQYKCINLLSVALSSMVVAQYKYNQNIHSVYRIQIRAKIFVA